MEPATEKDTGAVRDVEIFIEAAETYPAMERAFLNAQTEIWASYRVFDLWTRLRSPEARALGDTWFDLLVHVLRRGVAVHIVLSDFDPVVAQELHCASWNARRAFVAAAELAGPKARLQVINAIHSARVGHIPRHMLWPRVQKRLRRIVDDLNQSDPARRARLLNCSPGLRPLVRQGKDGSLMARWWPPVDVAPASHHQKIAVFDRRLLCVGGLDLDERRYDDKGHHRRRDETWHDVQLFCTGPVVADAQAHLQGFLSRVADRADKASDIEKRWESDSHFLITLSRKRRGDWRHLSPRPVVRAILDRHLALIRRANNLIYLESQFFRDRGLAQALADAARENPGLGLVLVMPGAPEAVAFDSNPGSDARFGEYLQAKCLGIVEDAFQDRLALCSPVRPVSVDATGRDVLCGSPIIYVHAKVSIFDKSAAIVSSANLNGRSLHWDTEAGVLLDQPGVVQRLRRRIFDHWLGAGDDDDALRGLSGAAQAWKARAQANAACAPQDRTGLLVPYDPAPARRIGRPLPGVPDEMV